MESQMTNDPNTPKPTLNQKRILDMSRFNAVVSMGRRNTQLEPAWH
jgi:hypothetical protein